MFKTAILISLVLGLASCGGNSTDTKSSQPEQDAASTPGITEFAEPVSDPITHNTETADPLTQEEADDEAEKPQPGGYYRPLDYPKIDVSSIIYIDSSSGHKIALRVTLPADENGDPMPGPFPVILVQSGYNVGAFSIVPLPGGSILSAPDPFMVRRGYAMVAADVVGTGASQGGWEMFGADEQAGYGDVVNWVLEQPWSNGDIGVTGASYMAVTGLFTAAQRPDAVKAIFAVLPVADPQRATAAIGGLHNGVFMSEWIYITHFTASQNVPIMLLHPQHMNSLIRATQSHISQIDNYYLPIMNRMMMGDEEVTYDTDFWRLRSPMESLHKIEAPTMIIGAQNDLFQRDEPLIYEALKDRVDARLIMFGGDHLGNFLQSYPGTEKTKPLTHQMLQWFDAHLKGMDAGIEDIPPVVQDVLHYGPGLWQGLASAEDWPHPSAAPERWYLRKDGKLDSMPPAQPEPPRSMTASEFTDYSYGKSDDGNFVKFRIDIKDGSKCSPSMSQWTLGRIGSYLPLPCYYTTTWLERNALNYETPPMEEDYYINGPIQADLWITSTTPDAVVAVRIDEVNRWGNSLPISTGILLASARTVDESRSRFMQGEMVQPYHYFTKEKESFLVPGQPTKLQVEIFPTSALIRKGNKLRISISPSNQAMGMVNMARRDRIKDGVTEILTTPEHPSSVVLLNVPTSELN